MATNESTLKAIYDNDLDRLLKHTKQYNDFVNGDVKCMYCGGVVNNDNISIIIPNVKDSGISLQFCCNNTECLNKYRNR